MRTFLLCTLVLFLFAAGPSKAQIKEEMSDVTDSMRLVSEDMRPLVDESYAGSHATFRAEYEHQADGTARWTVSLYGFADDTTAMSEASTVHVDANGQSLEPLTVTSRTRQVGDSVLEIKRADFTRPAFEQIATAERVTFSVGPAIFESTRPSRQDLRLILERVSREGPPTASSEEDSSSNPNR